MVISGENVILPNTPLFLVDRSWRSSSKNSKIPFDWQKKSGKSESVTLSGKNDDVYNNSSARAENNAKAQTAGCHTENQREQITETDKTFEFINATTLDHARGPEVQRLVRSHAKKSICRQRDVRRTSKMKSTTGSKPPQYAEGEPAALLPVELGVICSGSATPFYGNEANTILSSSRSQSLLSYYLNVVALSWYPLEHHLAYSPVKAGWLPLALTDEVLFRSILFSSASRLAIEDEHPNVNEPKLIVDPIFGQLNRRLKHFTELSDSTIAIVSCLAMVEISHGNYNKWNLHMTAIKEMVRLRGGLHSIDMSLQTKICRADIEGATDCLSSPHLPPLPRYFPVLSDDNLTLHPMTFFETLHICPRLYTVMCALSRLSCGIDHALRHTATTNLNPRALDEAFSITLHQLLLWQSDQPSSLNEVLRLGALLYAKSITRLASAHVRPVVQRFISTLEIATDEQQGTLPFRMWLFLVGAVSVRAGSRERTWFMVGLERLKKMAFDEKLATWDRVRCMLEEMPWVSSIHEAPWKNVWEEAEGSRLRDASSANIVPLE